MSFIFEIIYNETEKDKNLTSMITILFVINL